MGGKEKEAKEKERGEDVPGNNNKKERTTLSFCQPSQRQHPVLETLRGVPISISVAHPNHLNQSKILRLHSSCLSLLLHL